MAFDNLVPQKKYGIPSYKGMLINLLPSGALWKTLGDKFQLLMEGFAVEFDRLETAYVNLETNCVPGLSVDLLPDWERIALLPDELPASGASNSVRQQFVHAKVLTNYQNASRQFFTDLATSFGMTVTITDGATNNLLPARVEEATVEDSGTNDAGNIYYFFITVSSDPNSQLSRYQAMVKRLKPANTDVIYQ